MRKTSLCAPLSDAELAIVEAFKSGDRVVRAGTDLYAQGEPCKELYTVVSGWVFQYKLLEDGRRQIARVALPGDFVGFQPDLSANLDHAAQALTDARLCVFPREGMLALFRAHPELAIRLTWMIARDEGQARERLTSLGRRTARERVAHFLLELFYRLRLRDAEPVGASIPLPLTQEHLGDALGLTAVHVNRTLRQLREDGLIRIADRTLHVLDPDGLAVIAGFDDELFDWL